MPENEIDTLVAYLRQHGGRFAMDALRRQMLSEGHDPALVEEAVATYRRERPAPAGRPYWRLAAGIAALNLAVIVAVIAALFLFGDSLPGRTVDSLVLLLGAALPLEPVVGVVMIMVGGPVRRLGVGLLLGSVLFFCGLLLLAGAFYLFFIANP